MAVDVERMLQEALAKHGIRLDPQDPVVVLVTLNRLVLEDAAREVATDIRTAAREFEAAADRVQAKLGAAVAARIRNTDCGAVAPLGLRSRTWVAVGLCSGAGLFSMGVAVGRWVLR
jgi:hypothetical protein